MADSAGAGRQRWKQDPEGVRRALIEAATAEFARNGYVSTRIEDIVAQTAISKRMVYYYFTDKEGLYRQVLHHAYASVREREAALDLEAMEPAQALLTLVGFTFDHHRSHPEIIRLVMIENVHHAETLRQADQIAVVNAGAIAKLDRILARGRAEGLFHDDITALELHWQISGLCFFNVSNQPSFSAGFGGSLFAEAGQERLRRQVLRSVLLMVLRDPSRAEALLDTEGAPRDPSLEQFIAFWEERWRALPAGAAVRDRRKRLEAIANEMREPLPLGLSATEECWVDSEHGPARVRFFRPAGDGPLPLMIFLHGGAFVMGSPESHADLTAQLAAQSGYLVASVDYVLAPEHPFPAATEQVRTVALWLHDHAVRLGADPDRIVVCGDGAGGNLAAGLALALQGGPVRLAGQLLIYPLCDLAQDRPSYVEHADGPVFRKASLSALTTYYCPDAESRGADPRLEPLRAASHADLPPAYVALAEFDPLHDSGLAYARVLEAAGVPVTLDRGPGMVHAYLHALSRSPASRAALSRMASWLKALQPLSPAAPDEQCASASSRKPARTSP